MAVNSGKTLLIGVSGVSCSGKTTLARLLRSIWPNSFIIHEDDFYWSDKDIPVKGGVQDWDCLEAINLESLRKALEYVKQHGQPPPDHESKEDQNSVGESGVQQDTLSSLREDSLLLQQAEDYPKIAIMDGFLLFAPDMKQIWELLDVRLFLRTSYETAKKRREARSGYVTLEGFWEDPPGYVDDIVWPNYVKDHQHLFIGGDVEGQPDLAVCEDLRLHSMPKEAGKDMTSCLRWANRLVQEAILSQKETK